MSSKQDSGSGGIAKNIPILTGTANYHAWLDSIQSFLMTLNVTVLGPYWDHSFLISFSSIRRRHSSLCASPFDGQ
jgi:hypothetical protein